MTTTTTTGLQRSKVFSPLLQQQPEPVVAQIATPAQAAHPKKEPEDADDKTLVGKKKKKRREQQQVAPPTKKPSTLTMLEKYRAELRHEQTSSLLNFAFLDYDPTAAAGTTGRVIEGHQKIAPQPQENKRFHVRLMFLHMNKAMQASWLNWLASWWQRSNIIHVELQFVEDRQSFLINKQYPASFMADRPYAWREDSTRRWESIELEISEYSYVRMYNFCCSHMGDAFDVNAIYMFPCACGTDIINYEKERRWICSRLITAILIEGLVLRSNIDPYAQSPLSMLEMWKRYTQRPLRATGEDDEIFNVNVHLFRVTHQPTVVRDV